MTSKLIIDELIALSKEESKINTKIREIQLAQKITKKPKSPAKPIKPEIYKNKKPVFLKTGELILYPIIISVPLYLLMLFFFTPENMLIAFIICLALPLIPIYFIYHNSKKEYDQKENDNSKKINLFNNQNNEYTRLKSVYNQDVINYNEEINRIKKLDEIKLLNTEHKNVIEKIRPLIKEISSLEEISIDEKFQRLLMLNKYEYLIDNSFHKIKRITLSELKENSKEFSERERINKAKKYLGEIESKKLNQILEMLKEVEQIQKSNLTINEKTIKIKHVLWSKHSAKKKLWIGGLLGTLFGLLIFGTGGIGIAGLGSAFGIWGFLAGTTGGILISSLIQNFETKK